MYLDFTEKKIVWIECFKVVNVCICNYLLSCDYEWSNRKHSYEVMYTDVYISYIMAVVLNDLIKWIPPVPEETNQPAAM